MSDTLSDCDRLKQAFDDINVPYVVKDNGDGCAAIYTCSRAEQIAGKLTFKFYRQDTFFAFKDGKLRSHPNGNIDS